MRRGPFELIQLGRVLDLVGLSDREVLVSCAAGLLAVFDLRRGDVSRILRPHGERLEPSRVVTVDEGHVVMWGWEKVASIDLKFGQRAWSIDDGEHGLDGDAGSFARVT